MARIHAPMPILAVHEAIGWLDGLKKGSNLPPSFLRHIAGSQTALADARIVKDPVDGSQAVALTMQTVRPERLHAEDREGDNSPSYPRTRYWETTAAAIMILALANGNTMSVYDSGRPLTPEEERDPNVAPPYHYPAMFAANLLIHRVFMDAQQGEQVKVHVDRKHPFNHHDCRMRNFYKESGPAHIHRGVKEFLDIACETYAKPNRTDGLTGQDRFAGTVETYRQILVDALELHRKLNPSASPKQVAEWLGKPNPLEY